VIRVLQSLDEVAQAIDILQRKGGYYHVDPIKNWDLVQISRVLERLKEKAWILDVGCGASSSSVLRFLYHSGFLHSIGIDISIPIEDRLTQLGIMVRDRLTYLPYRLMRQNVTRTKFSDNLFDFIICLSVIEHGLDLESFMKEINRILKTDGILYLSTDYWEPKIETNGIKPFGLDWKIFSKSEIIDLVGIIENNGFVLSQTSIPINKNEVVHWKGKNYTEISLLIRKSK
jgi:SAM-dependent methyltransferase